ncbi:pyruvate kinase [Paracrocinitomix mangrovi]|uniref:pyruvate kinase n=1 Tax=Paracrocinitomix mangrovi TaxID=2862509 RepID=UPI001C8D8020|nr:pyruvate kinase [Paracrocinitomix mangrovi]UKN00862.1 pyruvate kinase [Paracrocinitomix mangrovi]
MKKTKIVATIGPSSSSKETLKKMIEAGLNVCRINFSHGAHEDHKAVIDIIREINDELGTNVALLADLQGPKIRIGEVEDNGVLIEDGSELIFTTEKCMGTNKKVYLSYETFPQDVKVGDILLVDDGRFQLKVKSTDGKKEVVTIVEHGGILSSKKGVNLPNTAISLPSLTEKDRKDLEFALSLDIDWIGLSFVRSAQDIKELKKIIKAKKKHAKVIAKIEKPEAVWDIEDIIAETDGVMIARGDLGVEVPMEKVPNLQKKIIKLCRLHAKPTIVATQMMESMIKNFRPTRAEVNDVANAVMDGADAVMLSGETSIGDHPVDVIKAMVKIVLEVEANPEIYEKEELPEKNQERFITDSICFNAARMAKRVDAAGIITMTFSGYTAYKISSQRPKATTYVFTENRQILTQLNLVWGVIGFFYDQMESTDQTIKDCKAYLFEKDYLKKGDLVLNIASIPMEERGQSNMMKLSEV